MEIENGNNLHQQPTTSIIYTYFSIYLFACCGILIRIFITMAATTTLPSSPTSKYFGTGYLIQNIVGTFILGILSNVKKAKYFISPSITTGFCGSLTTYSSWQLYITIHLLLKNNYQILDALMNGIVCHCMFYIAFVVGRHIGEWMIYKNKIIDLPLASSKFYRSYQVFIIFATIFIFIILLILTFIVENVLRPYILCCLLGSFGALLRYKLGLYNEVNNSTRFRYLFTFIANVSGTIIIYIVYFIGIRNNTSSFKNEIEIGTGVWSNDLLYSIQIGFCGSLTTVSTFMNELYILTTSGKEGVTKERGYLYQYIVITFVTCQILGLILSFIFV